MRDSVRLVGQRLMIGFDGLAASPDVKALIRDFGVGTVILFARNIEEPGQVAELVRELQGIARDAGHHLPLLVTIDQEGGRVARLREPWTVWPPLRAVGEIGTEQAAERMGAALAAELRACGIRWDLAPVLDVDTNPKNPVIGDRSFADDPEKVGRLGAAMIRGFQQAGVAACGKHFPGHGDTDLDSHLALPALDHSRSRLQDVELRPFRHAVQAKVASIMTAHVLVRELDEKLPATLSPRAIRELLRGELKFEGVIVSDDLEMKAVADHWPTGEAAVLAVKAGCDLLAACSDHDVQVRALEAVVRAVEAREIPWTEVEDSERRLRQMKEAYTLPYRDPDPRAARAAAGRGEHQALARELAGASGLA